LFVVPTAFDALTEKGVEHMITERDEGGFFSRVLTVHPFTGRSRRIDLGPVHSVIEFGRPRTVGRGMPRAMQIPALAMHLASLLRRIAAIARAEKIDLIRATDPYFAGFIAWLVRCAVPRAAFCVSIHADYDKRFELDGPRGAPVIFGSRALAKRLEAFVLRRADLVLPIRQHLGEMAYAAGVPRERIMVIPHGIDFAPFATASQTDVRGPLGLAPGVPILGFAGRLTRENYVDDILDLAEALARRRDDFAVVMAGDGPERARLEARIAATPALQRHVRLLGFVTKDTVMALRRQSALALCLMGGYSLIEACAAARPVIAYDVEWHRELVGAETGVLVTEGDGAGLVAAVVELLADPDRADAMGRAARHRALARHGLEAARAAKIAAYEHLLARP
jgi:glycosyltransferase involved in cell wall biosynthesis